MNDEEIKEYISKNEDKCNEVLDLIDSIQLRKRQIEEKHKHLKRESDLLLHFEKVLEKEERKLKELLLKDEQLSEMYLILVVKENITI